MSMGDFRCKPPVSSGLVDGRGGTGEITLAITPAPEASPGNPGFELLEVSLSKNQPQTPSCVLVRAPTGEVVAMVSSGMFAQPSTSPPVSCSAHRKAKHQRHIAKRSFTRRRKMSVILSEKGGYGARV